MKQGPGNIIYTDGARFEGNWKKDYADGPGVIHYSLMEKYQNKKLWRYPKIPIMRIIKPQNLN